ncbi:MAG: hypothetical protein J0H42_25730 [Rhizobiales bacterium]|nr:hypothetical protein [Hyphomicrobiales bacterium]
MQEYRAYMIDQDGNIQRRFDLICADEEDAENQAKQLVDGHDVELWRGDKRLAVFTHKPST